jgi:hypothetical protein
MQAPTSDALRGTVPEGVLPYPPRSCLPRPPFPPRPAWPAFLAQTILSGISLILFLWDLFGSSSLFDLPDKLTQTYSFVNVLEECDPVVLVLILMLVSVEQLLPELVKVKSILLAFLLSICHSQNYNILE